MTDDRAGPEARRGAGIVSGAAVAALGLVALAVAAVEYHVFADTGGGGGGLFGMSAGTSAYIVGYGGAGFILFALGMWKIRRALRK